MPVMEVVSTDQLKTQNSQTMAKTELPPELVNNELSLSAMLDAIALFELIGSKWMLAVPFSCWDEEIHEHCFDEVRHTKMVQDAAKKLRWQMSDDQLIKENKINPIFYQATEKYLSELSKKIFKLTLSKNSRDKQFSISAYSIMAFLIERRIMKIYPSIAKYGPNKEVKGLAKTIVEDERKHLCFVGDKLNEGLEYVQNNQKSLVQMEEALANQWLEKLLDANRRES